MPPTKITKATETPFALADAIETVWHKTTVHIYPVSDSQLAELTAGYNSVYLVFFGIFVGAAVSLGVTYPQITDVTLKPYYFAALFAAIGLAALSGIAAGERYVRASGAKQRLEKSVPLEPPKI
jgi:hypothetical protein